MKRKNAGNGRETVTPRFSKLSTLQWELLAELMARGGLRSFYHRRTLVSRRGGRRRYIEINRRFTEAERVARSRALSRLESRGIVCSGTLVCDPKALLYTARNAEADRHSSAASRFISTYERQTRLAELRRSAALRRK